LVLRTFVVASVTARLCYSAVLTVAGDGRRWLWRGLPGAVALEVDDRFLSGAISSLPACAIRIKMRKPDRTSHEFILKHFQVRPGLYVLGAGVSAGAAPLGIAFWRSAALDYLRNFSSFPASIPTQAELTERIIKNASNLTIDDIWPGRGLRPGTEIVLYGEILQRLPGLFVRVHLKHVLSAARYHAAQSAGLLNHSYGVFQYVHPSMIATYNHDGLAYGMRTYSARYDQGHIRCG